MPLYEYQCRDCGEVTEVIQRLSEPDPTDCYTCGGELERVLSAPAIRFKGSGWYVNDYGRGGTNGSGVESGPSGDSEDSGSKAKKDKKVKKDNSSKDSASKVA
jgi:putative FmdB family regulatory protein